MHQEDGEKCHVTSERDGVCSFFFPFFFYVAAAITVATDGSADDDDVADEDVGATRWYFGGESFTRVTEENYDKKKRKEGKREKTSTTTCLSFRSSRPRAPITLCYFVAPSTVPSAGSAERNKVYSFRGRSLPSQRLPLSLSLSPRKKVFREAVKNVIKRRVQCSCSLDVRAVRETWKLATIRPRRLSSGLARAGLNR